MLLSDDSMGSHLAQGKPSSNFVDVSFKYYPDENPDAPLLGQSLKQIDE